VKTDGQVKIECPGEKSLAGENWVEVKIGVQVKIVGQVKGGVR
jgi:hypothetical protein